MCIKEYDSCTCKRCRLDSSYEKTEKKLTLLANEYNKASKQYHSHLGKIYDKVGVKSWRTTIDHNYDDISKALWAKMEESDKMSKRQIYRLNSLERKLDLINEDEYYSQQYA